MNSKVLEAKTIFDVEKLFMLLFLLNAIARVLSVTYIGIADCNCWLCDKIVNVRHYEIIQRPLRMNTHKHFCVYCYVMFLMNYMFNPSTSALPTQKLPLITPCWHNHAR